MVFSNILKTAIFPLFAAIIMYFYSCHNGQHAIYLFDFSIVYNMGWLIFNGLSPFADFKMPLMPLSGTLVALSFYLFGVSYYSAVKLAAIISALSFIYIGKRLQKHLGYVAGYIAAFLIISATLPVEGTLYYNHLSMLLYSIFLVLVLNYIFEYKSFLGRRETLLSTEIYLFVALILFNKIHIGLLVGFLFFCLEAFLLMREKNKLIEVLPNLLIRVFPIIFLLSALLIWIDFNILDLVDSLFHSASASKYIDKGSLMLRMGFVGDQSNIFSSAGINLFPISLFSAGLLFYHLKFCKKNIIASKLLYLIIASLLIQIASLISSAEAPTIDLPFIMLDLVMIYVYLLQAVEIKNDKDSEKTKFIFTLFIAALFLSCATFITCYSREYLRKANDGGAFVSKSAMSKNKYISDVEFFDGIKINYNQKKNFDYLGAILHKYSSNTIFLGPEFEMFYPVANKFPPSKWPLWLHHNVSYKISKHDEMKEILVNQNYDVMIFSKSRSNLKLSLKNSDEEERDFTAFISNYVLSNYVELKTDDSEIWVRVFVKK